MNGWMGALIYLRAGEPQSGEGMDGINQMDRESIFGELRQAIDDRSIFRKSILGLRHPPVLGRRQRRSRRLRSKQRRLLPFGLLSRRRDALRVHFPRRFILHLQERFWCPSC